MSTSTESGPVMNDLEDRVRTLEQIPINLGNTVMDQRR